MAEQLRVCNIRLSEASGGMWETTVRLSNHAYYRWSADRRPEMGEIVSLNEAGDACGPLEVTRKIMPVSSR